MDSRAILEAALMLPENERLSLASQLLESVPSDDSIMSMDEPQLQDELDRRFGDLDHGIPWTELRSER